MEYTELYLKGKLRRKDSSKINQYAREIADLIIEKCQRVELSQGVYWFYLDDSDKVAIAILSDNQVVMSFQDIGIEMPRGYWGNRYYLLGKKLVQYVVDGVSAKMGDGYDEHVLCMIAAGWVDNDKI